MAEKKKQEAKGQAVPVEHMEVDFPRKFPSDSIMHFAGLARGTETMTKGEALQHAGIILGCSGKLLDPAPVGKLGAASAAPSEDFSSLSNEDIASRFSEAAAPKGDEAEFIPPWMVPLVFEVLRRIFGF